MKILERKCYEDYSIENNLLYKGNGDCKKLFIPKELQTEIIRKIDEQEYIGKRKIIEKILKDYFIDKLESKTDVYIKNCIMCILETKKQSKVEEYLNSTLKQIYLCTLYTWIMLGHWNQQLRVIISTCW